MPALSLLSFALVGFGGRTLATYHYLPATQADLLRRLGRHQAAAAAYRSALALVENDVERAFLEHRLAALSTQETGAYREGLWVPGRQQSFALISFGSSCLPASDHKGEGGSEGQGCKPKQRQRQQDSWLSSLG